MGPTRRRRWFVEYRSKAKDGKGFVIIKIPLDADGEDEEAAIREGNERWGRVIPNVEFPDQRLIRETLSERNGTLPR